MGVKRDVPFLGNCSVLKLALLVVVVVNCLKSNYSKQT